MSLLESDWLRASTQGIANRIIQNAYEYGPMRLGVLRSSQHVCGFGCVMPHSYYGYDGHGSVRYLTDPSGAVKDT